MDIQSHTRIELSLEIEENAYGFYMPVGRPIKEAMQAAAFFHSGLDKVLKEAEEKEAKEKEASLSEDSTLDLLEIKEE